MKSIRTESIIQTLGQRLGLALSFRQGVLILLDEQERQWWIEDDEASGRLLIHTAIERHDEDDEAAGDPAAGERLAHWLALNARPALLQGAWIGLDRATATLRLYAALAEPYVDAARLDARLRELGRLRRELPLPPPRTRFRPQLVFPELLPEFRPA
ncbi:type III secretion system chaperone [Chitinimonas koreensis]|uniref:type III secretion system chaperone n=1 Tax=Chitinimonas koreensis TaxID=356302 RepID=UPI0003FFD06F|nr:type III secretion system chaperone [Chitinimonas koreensis]QNM97650.1 CesT family type III secretion system chaperone [Chitinimonas koreensis]